MPARNLKIRRLVLPYIITRSFNCNLSLPDSQVSPRTTIVKGLFSDFLHLLDKMSDFTYIHISSRSSSLNNLAVYPNLIGDKVNIIFDYQLSDNLPIT